LNIQEYISSGILEAYVIGELTDAERVAVEKNVTQYRELQEELARIEEANEALLMKLAVEPPAAVRERIMQAVQPKGKVVPLHTVQVLRWKYAAAASVVIALGASFLAYDYHSKWKNSEFALNDLIAQNKQIAQDYNRVNLRLDKVENDLHVIDNPSFTKVVMKGTPNAPQAMASVYWNKQTKEIFLSIQNLKQLSQQNQYQLWAQIDGKMVDAGVFDGDMAGLVKMKSMLTSEVTVFAVTIEPRGGRPVPTVENLQVAGSLTKG
jgi:anti-sigma-K factor RskA